VRLVAKDIYKGSEFILRKKLHEEYEEELRRKKELEKKHFGDIFYNMGTHMSDLEHLLYK